MLNEWVRRMRHARSAINRTIKFMNLRDSSRRMAAWMMRWRRAIRPFESNVNVMHRKERDQIFNFRRIQSMDATPRFFASLLCSHPHLGSSFQNGTMSNGSRALWQMENNYVYRNNLPHKCTGWILSCCGVRQLLIFSAQQVENHQWNDALPGYRLTQMHAPIKLCLNSISTESAKHTHTHTQSLWF